MGALGRTREKATRGVSRLVGAEAGSAAFEARVVGVCFVMVMARQEEKSKQGTTSRAKSGRSAGR